VGYKSFEIIKKKKQVLKIRKLFLITIKKNKLGKKFVDYNINLSSFIINIRTNVNIKNNIKQEDFKNGSVIEIIK
jgi:hypothetical protein